MATGTQSSSSLRAGFVPQAPAAKQDEAPAVQPGVLRSGEKIATSQAALNDPKAKTFYAMVKGCNFTMPDGLTIQFLGGQFTTADEAIIAELDKVSNRSGSLIYTRQEVAKADEQLAHLAAADAVQPQASQA